MPDPVQPDNQQQQEAERPEWLPDNFDSPEALAKSYQEAQRKISEQGASLRDMEQNYADLSAQFEEWQSQAQQPAQAPDQSQALYAMFDQDPVATMALIANQAAQAAAAQATQASAPDQEASMQAQAEMVAFYADNALTQRYADWGELKDEVAEAIRQEPDLLPDSAIGSPVATERALERVYKMVRADKLFSGDPAAQQQPDSDAARLAKLQAQTQQGAGVRPATPEEDAAAWERIKNAGERPYWAGLQ